MSFGEVEPIYNTTQQAYNNLQLAIKINKLFLIFKLANPQHYEHPKAIFSIIFNNFYIKKASYEILPAKCKPELHSGTSILYII